MLDFWGYLIEREQIRGRRMSGMAAPWTEDETLRAYNFSNVFREDDPETRWMIELFTPLTGPERVLNAMLFRTISNREAWKGCVGVQTLEKWDPAEVLIALQAWNLTRPIFGSQTTVPSYVCGATQAGHSTVERWSIAATVWTEHLQEIARLSHTHVAFDAIHVLPGLGPYLSWQIAMDLLHLNQVVDDDWARCGPGAWAGLFEIYGADEFLVARKDSAKRKCGFRAPDTRQLPTAETRMHQLVNEQPAGAFYRSLTMPDIEHGLCEFGKYRRLSRGEKATSPRRRDVA